METTTPFDLNLAIERWRDTLAQSPAFRGENLVEMESHLRESLAGLQTHGLSEEESLLLATRRLGSANSLEQEFGKVNATVVWRDRALWMLAGMLIWIIGWDLSRLAAAATTCLGSLTATNGIVLGWFSAATNLLMLGLVATLFWLLTTGKLSRWEQSSVRMHQRPIGTAITLLAGMLLLKLAGVGLQTLSIHNLAPEALGQTYAVTTWFNAISSVLALVVMIILFSRLLSGRAKTDGGKRATALIFIPLVSSVLLSSSAPAQTDQLPAKPGAPATKSEPTTLNQALTLWCAGKHTEAVTKFLAGDFSKRPIFPAGSVLNYTEAQFMALPRSASEKLSKQMLDDISGLKGLCVQVRDAGRSALERGDKATADKCLAQLKQCGAALNHPDSLALLKLVGKAVQKMAAESTAAPSK